MRLSPAIEVQNRSLVIEGELPNPTGLVRPGSFVEGAIVVNSGAMGVVAPAAAIASFAGIDRAFVVKNGVLEDRVVRLGRRMPDGQVEVLEGLAAGDQLVAKAGDRMVKGQKARVR